jgi:hypothetical protein
MLFLREKVIPVNPQIHGNVMCPLFVLNFIFEPLFVHAPDIIVYLKFHLGTYTRLTLITYVDIVNAELIESTLKQTIMCSCFNDFVWLSKYKKCCVHLIFIDCFI